MTNARDYWDSVSVYGLMEHSDDIGNIDYMDRFDDDGTISPLASYLPYRPRASANYRDSVNYLLGLPPSSILFRR